MLACAVSTTGSGNISLTKHFTERTVTATPRMRTCSGWAIRGGGELTAVVREVGCFSWISQRKEGAQAKERLTQAPHYCTMLYIIHAPTGPE